MRSDNLEPSERGVVQRAAKTKQYHTAKYEQRRDDDAEWTHEFDAKVWCSYCRNHRSESHTLQHAAIVAGEKPPRRWRLW